MRAFRSRPNQWADDARVATNSCFAAHDSQLPFAYRVVSTKAPQAHVDERRCVGMDLHVNGPPGRPLNDLYLAIIHDHTDQGVVDVKLIHVVHAACRRSVESFTQVKEPPGGTERFGALSTVRCKESNPPRRKRNDRSGELLAILGELVDLRRGWRRQRSTHDQPLIFEAIQPFGEYRCADAS